MLEPQNVKSPQTPTTSYMSWLVSQALHNNGWFAGRLCLHFCTNACMQAEDISTYTQNITCKESQKMKIAKGFVDLLICWQHQVHLWAWRENACCSLVSASCTSRHCVPIQAIHPLTHKTIFLWHECCIGNCPSWLDYVSLFLVADVFRTCYESLNGNLRLVLLTQCSKQLSAA